MSVSHVQLCSYHILNIASILTLQFPVLHPVSGIKVLATDISPSTWEQHPVQYYYVVASELIHPHVSACELYMCIYTAAGRGRRREHDSTHKYTTTAYQRHTAVRAATQPA